jgi:hypothetical protein
MNKRPLINSSPKNKSPPRNNILRPSSGSSGNSGKDRIISNNNPILLRNDKKVIIEKVNYERGSLQTPVKLIDPKKGIINRNNPVNKPRIN